MKMFKRLKPVMCAVSMAACFTLTSVSLPSVAYANSKTATVYTKFTNQQLLNIIKKNYPNSKLVKENFIQIKVSDDTILHLSNSYSDGSLQLFSIYNDDIALSKLNQWNRDKRFAKAYRNDDNKTILSYDLDTRGGVTEAAVLQYISRMFMVDFIFGMAMSD